MIVLKSDLLPTVLFEILWTLTSVSEYVGDERLAKQYPRFTPFFYDFPDTDHLFSACQVIGL